MNTQQATIETMDTEEARETAFHRLSALLNQYPTDPKFQGMTDDEITICACKVVYEVRQAGENSAI